MLIGAGAGLLAWAALGPVATTRSIASLPGDTPIEWRGDDGASINGVWVLDTAPLRAPARGIREVRADRPVQVTERVLGMRGRGTTLDPRGAWTAVPAGLGLADALACAVLGAVLGGLLGALACAARRATPGPTPCPTLRPNDAPAMPASSRPAPWPALLAVLIAAVAHGEWALKSPLIFCPDSMDYAVRALELVQRGDFHTFDALRTPGFSVVLAGLSALHLPLAPALGVLHTLVAAVIAWVIADIAGRVLGAGRVAGGFALAAGVAATLDPVVLLWSRHAMPEMLATGAATLAVWAAFRAGRHWVWWAILSGVLAAVAAYTRGNLQVVVALCPIIVLLAVARCCGPGRALAAAALCLASALALLAPWSLRNARTFGVPALAVGSQYARVLSASDAGILDLNQSAAFDRAAAARLASTPSPSGFEVIRLVDRSRLAARGGASHPWIASERRLQIIADESARRWPDRHWRAVLRGALNLAGLWPMSDPGFREHEWWGSAWRSGDRTNFWNPPEDYGHLTPDLTRRVHDQNVLPINFRISDAAWEALRRWKWVQVGLALLSLVACAWLWHARRWAEAAIFMLPWVHAIALAVLTGTGIDRYQVPLFPLATLAGVFGLWCLLRSVMRLARSQTSTSVR